MMLDEVMGRSQCMTSAGDILSHYGSHFNDKRVTHPITPNPCYSLCICAHIIPFADVGRAFSRVCLSVHLSML